MKLYRIESCWFKREKYDEYEPGLLLSEGNCGIMDQGGKIIVDVWDWRKDSALAIDINAIFESMIRSTSGTVIKPEEYAEKAEELSHELAVEEPNT